MAHRPGSALRAKEVPRATAEAQALGEPTAAEALYGAVGCHEFLLWFLLLLLWKEPSTFCLGAVEVRVWQEVSASNRDGSPEGPCKPQFEQCLEHNPGSPSRPNRSPPPRSPRRRKKSRSGAGKSRHALWELTDFSASCYASIPECKTHCFWKTGLRLPLVLPDPAHQLDFRCCPFFFCRVFSRSQNTVN